MLMPGIVGLGGVRFLQGIGSNVSPGLLPLERATWLRAAAPALVPDGSGFDGTNIFMPVIARNLDRSPYQDGDGKYYQYYIATSVEDRSGLALGTDFDTWTRYSADPVLDLGLEGSPDWGDAQITSVYFDGTEFVGYYQGNANGSGSGGDEVTVCQFTSADGKTLTKQGIVLDRGPVGDALDLYVPRLVPAGHDGLPRLYYTGQDASSVRGLMCAVSLSGNIRGPWTRLRDDHLYRDGSSFLGDAWYDADDELYHILYSPLDTVRAIMYATSEDGENFTLRRELVPRNIGEWDTNPFNAGFYELNGTWYIWFNSSSSIGNGYHYAVPPA
ncbi:hypothetical protein [Mesorhizobium sp. WSM2239]|uniref:Glycosyl hydrolase family 32 N-terminal domain-containing protein n=2 Tax=unclassified Mesorhizobium TaxID=325217 RepID=A0AAU8D2I3_9HYPH